MESTWPTRLATVREKGAFVCAVRGVDIGIVGTKGFIGGFTGSLLPDFGEPILRRVYAETGAEVSAIDRGLQKVAGCPIRIGTDAASSGSR